MIPVILGILIALFLNNWKESRDEKKFIDTVLISISKEHKENQKELIGLIEKRKVLLDTLNYYKNNEAVSIGDILNKVHGIQGALIKNTSWKTIQNSNIELMEYEMISTLTDIDLTTEHMKFLTQKVADFVLDNLESSEFIKKEILSISIGDLFYTEKDLLQLHENYMKLYQPKE